jgi:hypothetical protein
MKLSSECRKFQKLLLLKHSWCTIGDFVPLNQGDNPRGRWNGNQEIRYSSQERFEGNLQRGKEKFKMATVAQAHRTGSILEQVGRL